MSVDKQQGLDHVAYGKERSEGAQTGMSIDSKWVFLTYLSAPVPWQF